MSERRARLDRQAASCQEGDRSTADVRTGMEKARAELLERDGSIKDQCIGKVSYYRWYHAWYQTWFHSDLPWCNCFYCDYDDVIYNTIDIIHDIIIWKYMMISYMISYSLKISCMISLMISQVADAEAALKMKIHPVDALVQCYNFAYLSGLPREELRQSSSSVAQTRVTRRVSK